MRSNDEILVVNELPWKRVVSGPIAKHIVEPRGDAGDVTSARHFQDRSRERPRTNSLQPPAVDSPYASDTVFVPPTEVPGYGYTVIPHSRIVDPTEWPYSSAYAINTDRYEVRFDSKRGGIQSLYDTRQESELVDQTAEYPFGGYVHESPQEGLHNPPRQSFFDYPPTVDDWKRAVAGLVDAPRGFQSDWAARRVGAEEVKDHRVYETPFGYEVHQCLTTPTVESDVLFRVFLPKDRGDIVIEASWEMGMTTQPEATYLVFPFDIDNPTARLDVGGQPMRPEKDQIPGVCKDYFAVQRWVDLSNQEKGVTVSCPLNPMVQLGEFNFGRNQSEFSLDTAHLYGWVTNNYWDTNFRARQPGRVRARYHISPHGGPFDESKAHRSGAEAASWHPIAQTQAESTDSSSTLPPEESLLDLPKPPVLVFQIRSIGAEVSLSPVRTETHSPGLIIGLQNASDDEQTTKIDSALLDIQSAREVTLLNDSNIVDHFSVVDGTVTVDIEPRRQKVIRIDCAHEDSTESTPQKETT